MFDTTLVGHPPEQRSLARAAKLRSGPGDESLVHVVVGHGGADGVEMGIGMSQSWDLGGPLGKPERMVSLQQPCRPFE